MQTKMKPVIPTSLNRLIKGTAVPLMSQVFFISEFRLIYSLPNFKSIRGFVSKKCNICLWFFVSLLHRYIIGKKGETRRRLEFDTKTNISIPKPGVEGQIGED